METIASQSLEETVLCVDHCWHLHFRLSKCIPSLFPLPSPSPSPSIFFSLLIKLPPYIGHAVQGADPLHVVHERLASTQRDEEGVHVPDPLLPSHRRQAPEHRLPHGRARAGHELVDGHHLFVPGGMHLCSSMSVSSPSYLLHVRCMSTHCTHDVPQNAEKVTRQSYRFTPIADDTKPRKYRSLVINGMHPFSCAYCICICICICFVFVLFCFCFVLFCFVLFCFVLFCFVLFCFPLLTKIAVAEAKELSIKLEDPSAGVMNARGEREER